MQLRSQTSMWHQLRHKSWIFTWLSMGTQATLRHGPLCQHREDSTMTLGGRENHSESYVPRQQPCDIRWQHIPRLSPQLTAIAHIMNICMALSGSIEHGHQQRPGRNNTMDPNVALCGNIGQTSQWTQVAAQANSIDVHHPLIIAHRSQQGFRLLQTADIHMVFGGISDPGCQDSPGHMKAMEPGMAHGQSQDQILPMFSGG